MTLSYDGDTIVAASRRARAPDRRSEGSSRAEGSKASQRAVDVREAIERAPLGSFQLNVAGLSALVIMLDGYDVLCVSFAAPSLARATGIDVADFGPIFGAGFFGLLVGSLLFSPFGDLYGRKSVLLVSIAVFGVFSLMPIFDPSYGRLLIYRFVTGLGLAGRCPPPSP